MYWYISFLRPPPITVSSSTTEIVITPQVANDLRTELRYELTDIFYTWTGPAGDSTQLQQLTTYIPPQSTYKPIPVPLPTVKSGEKWRLGLFASAASEHQTFLKLGGLLSDQPEVLGVWSEGITIVAPASHPNSYLVEPNKKRAKLDHGSNKTSLKGKGKEKDREDGPKQTRIRREWILDELEANHNALRIIEQTSFDLDKKIWDSGLALSSWLYDRLTNKPENPHEGTGAFLKLLRDGCGDSLNILEIGSGTGLVSIALGLALRSTVCETTRRAKITATDLESAIELMQENISLNDLAPPGSAKAVDASDGIAGESRISVEAKVLDWDQELPSWVTEDPPDVIIAADVTYNTASFPSLVKTLTSLLNLETKPGLLLAYKERDPAERDLWSLLLEQGVRLELIHKIKGAEEDGQVELYLGEKVTRDQARHDQRTHIDSMLVRNAKAN